MDTDTSLVVGLKRDNEL